MKFITLLIAAALTCLSLSAQASADTPLNFPTTGNWTGNYHIVQGPSGGIGDCGTLNGQATLNQTGYTPNDSQFSGTLTLTGFSNTQPGTQRFPSYGQGASIDPANILLNSSNNTYYVTLNAGTPGKLTGAYNANSVNMTLLNSDSSPSGCSLTVYLTYQK